MTDSLALIALTGLVLLLMGVGQWLINRNSIQGSHLG